MQTQLLSLSRPLALILALTGLLACSPMDSLRKPPPERQANERPAAVQPKLAGPDRRAARAYGGNGRIALLLPLSGKSSEFGEAVKTGFLEAFYAIPTELRPSIRVYDVARDNASSAYLQAVADGAQIVVGPLTRTEVMALADTTDGRVTTLALNFLPDQRRTPANFFQFALSPEDEARAVARRVVADGVPYGVTLLPANDWGRRVNAAFADELVAQGGMVLDSVSYPSGTTDFSQIIPKLMKLRAAGITEGKRVYQPRNDAGFIFMGGQPLATRLIRSQLRFNFSGRIPSYTLPDAYDPWGGDNLDLDGVTFPDMPWILESEGEVADKREAAAKHWGLLGNPRGRFYAFGMDALTVAMELREGTQAFSQPLPGVTGELRLDDTGRVRRTLAFARVQDGKALPVQP